MVKLLTVSAIPLAVLAAVHSSTAVPLKIQKFNVLDGAKMRLDKLNLDVVDLQDDDIPDMWFDEAIIDHTGGVKGNWKQRYHMNDKHYGGKGSPVFLYINGEGPADADSVGKDYLLLNVLAKKHKAMVVAPEHRFYGLSHPFKDITTEHLKYLSASEGLADLQTFHKFFTKKHGLEGSKWIAFGGSYPGNLAAWVKLKYPDLFVGTIASSAPVLAEQDFHEYMEIVGNGLRYFGGDKCVEDVRDAVNEFVAAINNPYGGLDDLSKQFTLCSMPQTEFDISVLQQNVMGNFQGIAQYNDFQKFNLKSVCDHFGNTTVSPLDRLASFNTRFFTGTNNCTSANYAEVVTMYKKIEYSDFTGPLQDARQWFYQTCSEFGYGQTAASGDSPFNALSAVNVDNVYTKLCNDVFGMVADVGATNELFGGLTLDIANVTFTNGNVDPWSGLGFTNDTGIPNAQSNLIYMDGTAHCRDMYSPMPSDSGSVKWAQKIIVVAVAQYLS